MTRIKIIVEGPTEESFINEVLAPLLWAREIYVTPFRLGVAGHKGGNVNYARVRKNILLILKQDRTTYCSTMFDLYGLGNDFPGMPLPTQLHGQGKATRIEQGIREDLLATDFDLRPDIRLLPYLQVHEYEGLLFSDPEVFATALGKDALSPQLRKIRDSVSSPEEINDNPNTAPSKRVSDLYPSYQKSYRRNCSGSGYWPVAHAPGVPSFQQLGG